MTYENEIPKELVENKIYTSKQIKLFIAFNDVTVMCKNAIQFLQKDLKYRVIQIKKGYLESSLIDYTITPSEEEKVYIVEEV